MNLNSKQQLSEFIYDRLGIPELKNNRTDNDARKVDDATLNSLKCRTKKQKEFINLLIERNKLQSKVSKYLSKFADCCKENDGLLHGNFNQTVTKTGRLSSNGKKYKTQLQNLDRDLKPLFKARNEGWKIYEADYSQLEFRVAAYLGRDTRAIQDILANKDIHKQTAAIINGIGEEYVTKDQRQRAKADTFKPLYGGATGTKEQQNYYREFREMYRGISEWQERNINNALSTGKLVNETGLLFYFNPVVTQSGYVTESTNISNFPVQYLATGEIVPIAVFSVWNRIKKQKLESFIVNTIHDSIILEVKPDEESKIKFILEKGMKDDVLEYLSEVYDIQFNVPLDIEVKSSEYWGK